MSDLESIPAIIDQLCEMFDESVAALRSALAAYLLRGERPDPEARARGLFAYPELRIDYSFDSPPHFPPRAFGRLNQPGRYAISVARPRHFRKYLAEQLEYLVREIFAEVPRPDRKSTRLNSSHSQISYAVFCLKKKKSY